MRAIRILMTTLIATGLASIGYARPAARVTPPNMSALMAGTAAGSIRQQQDEQKPKETPETKPKTEKQDKQAKKQKPANTQKQREDDKKQDRNIARQDQKQDRDLAKQDQKEDKGQQSKGGRIPDKDLKAHFGQEHKFSVRTVVTTTTIVPNQTQFVYSGYTFIFLDPWPAGWAMDDDCYIDYVDGGYFLFDIAHPGIQITLNIVG
jgi:DNA mismatch repair ATPase MutL